MPPALFTCHHLLFLETKRNVIIDGQFTKLIYSDNDVVLNAIYLQFPVVPHLTSSLSYMVFSVDDPGNLAIVRSFERIERQILQYYQTYMGCRKTPVFMLSNQLQRGGFKLYRGTMPIRDADNLPAYFEACTLKISGVWETQHQIGITFKFMTNTAETGSGGI